MTNFGDKINTNGFDKHPEHINRTGANRKISIKRELEKLLKSDGTLVFKGAQIIEMGEKNGERFVKIKLPTQEALAHKMISIAMGSNKQSNTLRALIQLLEQWDGKPNQKFDANVNSVPNIIFENVSQKK